MSQLHRVSRTRPAIASTEHQRSVSRVASLAALAAALLVACAPGHEPGPAPTTTPTGDEPTNVLGPAGPETSGVTDGVDLERHQPGTVERDGTVLDGVHVPGDLTIEADRVTLRDVRIDGKLQVRGHDVTVEDVEVGTMAISAAENMVVRRAEVFGAEGQDGIHVTSGRATVRDLVIEDTWIHSPQLSGGSHYDGIQVRGVEGLTIRRSTIDLGEHHPQHTAAVFLEEANGGNSGVLIEGNLLNGGGYTLYLSGADVTVRGNTFGREAGYGPVYPDTAPRDLVSEDNTWIDGEPVDLTR